MSEPFDIYCVSSVAGNLKWHTFSLWPNRSIYKFCPLDDWPKWQKIGYHVRKLKVIAELRMEGAEEQSRLMQELEEDRRR
jgi:hypothetical protein